MKVLVIGSKGMLGTDLTSQLEKDGFETVGWGRDEIDITSAEDMKKIETLSPDIIINCAAYTNVDRAEREKDLCHRINVEGIRNLIGLCKITGTVLIQISTDYVFSGKKKGYDEEDGKDPVNYYGKTKAEGEDLIEKNLEKYYIVRTAWLFGKNGKNFVETIKSLSEEKEEIKVVNDQTGSPTFTKDLSKGIIGIMQNKYKYGIYHLTNSGSCTWFDFAREIVKLHGSRCKVRPCSTDEFPRDAERPKFSILNNKKMPGLRPWKEALKEYMEEG